MNTRNAKHRKLTLPHRTPVTQRLCGLCALYSNSCMITVLPKYAVLVHEVNDLPIVNGCVKNMLSMPLLIQKQTDYLNSKLLNI